MIVIEIGFARDDFAFNIVAQHSSTTTPAFYKLTAMWSSQEGSLLLWAWVLSIASSLALRATRKTLREIVPYATAVMMGIAVFFIGLMLFAGNVDPFMKSNPVPAEGVGLQPLLRHWAMMIHPPMLYSGYVSFTIPFAFAIGALITRSADSTWIRATRRFTLIAWTFLGFGLLLGSYWSYEELGWGGYWAWDPVENAAIMPWLMGTAFLHSVMVQEKRGMLRVWNVALIVTTFSLALLGTFLVRSGVLQSIHAFGDSTVGPYILGLIAIVVIGSTLLIISRLDDLRSERRIESFASREAIFLLNNLLLVALTAVIFWGTFFPLISELFTGDKASLAAPWFDTYTAPVAVGLVLFTGIGPLLVWKRMGWKNAKKTFTAPIVVSLIAGLAVLLLTDAGSEPLAFAIFLFGIFTLVALSTELWRGAIARRRLSGESLPVAAVSLVSRNRRRYGGYIVHAGIAFLLIGIAASSSFQTKEDITLKPGESATVGAYNLTYKRPTVDVTNERISFGADLLVSRDGGKPVLLNPSRNYFRPNGEPSGPIASYFDGEATSEIGLQSGLRRDFWTAVQPNMTKMNRTVARADAGFRRCIRGAPGTPPACGAVGKMMRAAAADPSIRPVALDQIQQLQVATIRKVADGYLTEDSAATFRVLVNPMVTWMWIGALIAISGAMIALWPTARGRRARAVATRAAKVKAGKPMPGSPAGGESGS